MQLIFRKQNCFIRFAKKIENVITEIIKHICIVAVQQFKQLITLSVANTLTVRQQKILLYPSNEKRLILMPVSIDSRYFWNSVNLYKPKVVLQKEACATSLQATEPPCRLLCFFLAWINEVFWPYNQLELQYTKTIFKRNQSVNLRGRTVGLLAIYLISGAWQSVPGIG